MNISAFLGVLLLAASITSMARADLHGGREVSKLPEGIEAKEGKLSLLVDKDRKDEHGNVLVYLVNRTGQDLTLNAQDGDVYMKLETKGADGKWQRAQSHAYSWCGNSYYPRMVKAGQFIELKGYQPTVGAKKARVRFSLYQQDVELFSEAFDGLAADSDVDKASHDAMAVKTGDMEFVCKVALGEIELENKLDHLQNLQEVAIWTLAQKRFDPDRSDEILTRVLKKFPEKKAQIHTVKLQLEAIRKSEE